MIPSKLKFIYETIVYTEIFLLFLKMDRINKVIADLVTQTGETDKAIAAKLGISPQLLGQYKSGKKKPGFEVIQKFNSVFNQDLVG